ncbi:hypothetical protein RFI_26010, partial [Reticulomyxa filosa]
VGSVRPKETSKETEESDVNLSKSKLSRQQLTQLVDEAVIKVMTDTNNVSGQLRPESAKYLIQNEVVTLTPAMRVDMMKQWTSSVLHLEGFMDWIVNALSSGGDSDWWNMFSRNTSKKTSFDSLQIHRFLTIDQLDLLGGIDPELWKQSAFFETYIKKLTPNAMMKYENVEWSLIPRKDRKEFLNTLFSWACERLTEPVQRSLKSAILFLYIDLYQEEVCLSYLRVFNFQFHPLFFPPLPLFGDSLCCCR